MREGLTTVLGYVGGGLLAVGAVAGVDHGLHNPHFFGPGSSILIGAGGALLGALLGRCAR